MSMDRSCQAQLLCAAAEQGSGHKKTYIGDEEVRLLRRAHDDINVLTSIIHRLHSRTLKLDRPKRAGWHSSHTVSNERPTAIEVYRWLKLCSADDEILAKTNGKVES
jgi:hypothetical protein